MEKKSILVLVPGFEPGSPPRKGGMMDRTTPHERCIPEKQTPHNRNGS